MSAHANKSMTASSPLATAPLTTAVVGLGISGMSCLRHLAATDTLVVIDDRAAPPNLAAAQGVVPDASFYVGEQAQSAERWQGVDRVVLSPGVAANDPVLVGSEALLRCSDIDLFMEAAAAPVIGITGTNGKSTVTALLGHILSELGVQVRVGGNLGEPALDLLTDTAQAYVLELSSFQLEHSGDLVLAAATVLNVSADHLDRHGDMTTYAKIKRQIYACALLCVGNADDAATLPAAPSGVLRTFGCEQADWGLLQNSASVELVHAGKVFASAQNFALAGQHNMLNVLASFALVAELGLPGQPQFVGNEARYVAAAASFAGLAHRAEFVRELDGVRYINDSKATNVGASIAALAGYAEAQPGCASTPRVVLLAGGQGKGADFSPLSKVAASCVKHALVFGEDAALIASALSGATAVTHCDDFTAAVSAARRLAVSGDTVLLAPACASFDMFSSFTARGERFCELVEAFA